MDKHFKAIVENGYQILQTPGGERVNFLLKTNIIQDAQKVGKCIFSANVNYNPEPPSALIYDVRKNQLSTHSGEILEVDLLEFMPKNEEKPVDSVIVACTVIFPYETNHKELTTNNQQLITA